MNTIIITLLGYLSITKFNNITSRLPILKMITSLHTNFQYYNFLKT